MKEFPKLHEMLKAALDKATQECSTLLGQDLGIAETSIREVTRDAYLKGTENASFIVAIESQSEYQGTFYLVMPFRDAIVMSGTLLGVPPARIQEKKRLAILEADDVDAFSEIANQLIGSFNTVFKQFLPQKVHLKQRPPQKYIPQAAENDSEELVADGEYYLLRAPLVMAGSDLEQLELLIPLPLATLFDLQNREEEAANEADGSPDTDQNEASEPESTTGQSGTVLILNDNDRERRQFQDILAASGVNPVLGALDADLKMLLAEGNIQAVVVGIDSAEEPELALCLDIQTYSPGVSMPVILCARQWTRTAVLKALKNGAREILLKPCPPEELTTKVMKCLQTA